jgi:hypothetical protein
VKIFEALKRLFAGRPVAVPGSLNSLFDEELKRMIEPPPCRAVAVDLRPESERRLAAILRG